MSNEIQRAENGKVIAFRTVRYLEIVCQKRITAFPLHLVYYELYIGVFGLNVIFQGESTSSPFLSNQKPSEDSIRFEKMFPR